MIPPDPSRAFAIVVNDKIVAFSATDTTALPFEGRILPVTELEQPVPSATERLLGPNYRLEADAVYAYYWLEAV